MTSSPENKEIKTGMKLSLTGICFYMAFISITTGPVMTGFLVSLGITEFEFSVAMTLFAFIGGVQIFLPYFLQSVSNRKLVIIWVQYNG